jgi:hypothetical protein
MLCFLEAVRKLEMAYRKEAGGRERSSFQEECAYLIRE